MFEFDAKTEPEKRHPGDAVWEIVEGWLPAYYTEIRAEWVDAGCPEPEEFTTTENIHNAMTVALHELATEELSAALAAADNYGEAVQAMREQLQTYAKQ